MSHNARGEPVCRGRRGRPVQLSHEAREQLILEAMEDVVAKSGLQRASMAAIARAAGMSKRTLYEVYGSREQMFDDWVRRKRARHVRPLASDEADLPIAERLRHVFRLDACGRERDVMERGLVVLRAVIAEAPHMPDLARTVFLSGAEAAHAIVFNELDRAVARGELAIDDIDAAARLLVDMVGLNPLQALLDPAACEVLMESADERLAYAIDIFVKGHAPRAEAPAPVPTRSCEPAEV